MIHKIKITYQFIVLTMLATGFFSCTKFLDRVPQDKVSQETFWQTTDQLNAYILGVYDWLPAVQSNGALGPFIEDVNSDLMTKGTRSTWLNGENNVTPPTGGLWDWSRIRQINIFFDNCKKCTDAFPLWKQTYGEACFLKAYQYHYMIRNFGDVPWYSSEVTMSDKANLYKARDKRSVVVDSIMALMDKAIVNLSLKSSVGVNRINVESALILKSRIALYEATWAKYHKGYPEASDVDASKLFAKAIEAFTQFKTLVGPFAGKLYSTGNPDQDFFRLYNRYNLGPVEEVTLSRRSTVALTAYGLSGNNVQYVNMGGAAFTTSWVSKFLTKQGTSVDNLTAYTKKGAASLKELATMLDSRFSQTIFIPGFQMMPLAASAGLPVYYTVPPMTNSNFNYNCATGFQPKFGYDDGVAADAAVNPVFVQNVIFRIPELMLNYAEAYVELNGTYPDLSDNIDLIRTRVGMPTLTSVKPVVGSWWPDYGYPVSDALATIRLERTVELAGDGYRTNDWMRWRAHKLFDGKRPKGFIFDPADYTNPPVSNPLLDADGRLDPLKVSLGGNNYTFSAGRDYLMPIARDQLMLNKNLKQNPGWDSPQ